MLALLIVFGIGLAIVAIVVGIFNQLVTYRNRFKLISTDRAAAREKGWNMVWWDFLFYAGVAVVVTISVPIAGVLVVFSLLVVPPVSALLVLGKSRFQLAFGWLIAGIGSLVGILASVAMDLPAGPALIAALVMLMLMAAAVARWRRTG